MMNNNFAAVAAVFVTSKTVKTKTVYNQINRQIKVLFIIASLLTLLFYSTIANSRVLYLKPGQSQSVSTEAEIGTVFISNQEVADYKVVGKSSVVVYAKNTGTTDFFIYDTQDNIIVNSTLEVDALLTDLHYKIKQAFPGNDIRISRVAGYDNPSKNMVYILSGTATDEISREKIYDLVGNAIKSTVKLTEIEFKDDNISSYKVDFLQKRYYANVINNIKLAQENQVNVKLTIVEVSKDFSDALGIEWQNVSATSLLGGGEIALNSPGIFNLVGFKKGFDANNITTVIRAIQNDTMAKVLAEPNLTVLSGEVASFLVGGEIPIVVAKSSSNDSTTIEYKEYGIKLIVGAKVDSVDKIRLNITNELSSISGSYAFNDYQIPTLSTRRTQSTILLSDGDSFAIGGLLSEQDVESLSKIPFIGDIPILGALARSGKTARQRTELVVFATVKLVTPKTSFDDVYMPIMERTDSTNLFFNIKNNHDRQFKNTFPLTNESERFLNGTGFLE